MTNSPARVPLLLALSLLGAEAALPASATPLSVPPCAVPSFAAGVPLPVPPETTWAVPVGVGDVNGDGRADVVAVRAMPETSPFRGSLAVWRSNGTGFLPPPPTEPILSASSSAPLFADVDGDGRGDLLLFAAAGSPRDRPTFRGCATWETVSSRARGPSRPPRTTWCRPPPTRMGMAAST